jgi:hypothetical protein
MNDTVDVRLRYTVTGSMSAAKRGIREYVDYSRDRIGQLPYEGVEADYSAKLFTVDVNPDENTGYSNYETCHVGLFLSNTSDISAYCLQVANEALKEETPTVWLADRLELYVEQRNLKIDQREARCRSDVDHLAHSLLTAALGRVNWRELAEEWLTAARENQEPSCDGCGTPLAGDYQRSIGLCAACESLRREDPA